MKLWGLSAAALVFGISSAVIATQAPRLLLRAENGQGQAGSAASVPGSAPGPAKLTKAEDVRARLWQPAAGLVQLPLWPEGLRIQLPETALPETTVVNIKGVAGRPWTAVRYVSRPTMTIYPPKGRNTGAAIMVFPGGGYEVLAIDLEGSEICDWITAAGMTCILLKYRVPQDWHKDRQHEHAPAVQLPLQDAQRAMGLIRQRATALNIDPHKIGVIGFSAGGHLVAAISNADRRTYTPVDAADREPSRPDFAIALYPGHLWSGQGVGLSPWNAISRDAPPTFLLQSMNDPVDDVHHAIAYALALRDAKVPVEMHLYAEGGHAFGLRPTPFVITTEWPKLVEKWLHTIKAL